MNKRIDLSRSSHIALSVISTNEAENLAVIKNKGWSFTNIYHLNELRNIYLALSRSGFDGDISKFTLYCKDNVPFEEKPWTYRRVEEYINALRNFGILGKSKLLINDYFSEKSFYDPLNSTDIEALKKIYYTYFRFREIHSWFISPNAIDRREISEVVDETKLIKNSIPIFLFSLNSRFTDAFITDLSNNTNVFFLDNKVPMNRALMRLWDVYIKWGRTLGVLVKFALSQADIFFNEKKVINCAYHIATTNTTLNLYDYIVTWYGKKRVFIPELVIKIAVEKRISVEWVKQFIIDSYIQDRELFSLDNTSEIFIKVADFRKGETILYPLYRDSYISHITIIK